MTAPGVAVTTGVGDVAATFTPTPATAGPQAGDLNLAAALGDPGAGVVEEGVSVPVRLGPVVVVNPDAARAITFSAGFQVPAVTGPVKVRGRLVWWFPFVARALATLLIECGLAELGRIGTETPVDLQSQLPFIRIVRVGGDSDLVNDHAQVDLDVFAATSVDGEELSEAIRQLLTMPAPPYVDGVRFDRIACLTAAVERPWADVNIRRYGATYRVVARRQPTLLP